MVNLTKETNATVNNKMEETNMNKENLVVAAIKEMGVSATVSTVFKNGIEKKGITLGDGEIRPTFYIDGDNRDINIIANQLIKHYENLDPASERILNVKDYIYDWEQVKNKIIPCLMKDKEEKLVTRKFLDLNVYYRIIIDTTEEGMASAKITEDLFKNYGVTKTELYNQALANVKGTYGAKDICSVLMGLGVDLITEGFDNLETPMFVVTNESGTNGSTAFLDNSLFKAIANDLHSDLYIIPSSIHELLVCTMGNGMTEEMMTSMIQDVNATQVSPEERLSDHVYFFRREVGKVESR